MSPGLGTVTCPICHKPVDWNANAFRPFCSERCRMIDLGQWVDETYRVPGERLNTDGATNEPRDDDDLDG